MDNSTLQIVLQAKDEITQELKRVQKEVNSLAKDMKAMSAATSGSANGAKKDIQGLGTQAMTTRDQVRTLIGTLQGLGALRLFAAIGGWYAIRQAGLYAAQSVKDFQEAEVGLARLTHVLQVSTGASHEQINALVSQAEALQKVGVVSKDAIVIAQGTFATFDLQAESIRNLIPSFLDMIVAEKGVNATTDDMISYANALAGALQGNYGALSKRGFILDEDTKKMIENGTEAEKVAAIIEVLNSTYEGMNEQMRKTDAGGAKALQMSLADIREEVGKALTPAIKVFQDEIARMGTMLLNTSEKSDFFAKTLYAGANLVAGSLKVLAVGIGTVVVPAVTLLIGVVKWAIQAMTMWWDIIKGVGRAFTLIKEGDFSGAASSIKEGITEGFSGFGDIIKDTSNQLASGYAALGEIASSAGDNFKEAFTFENFGTGASAAGILGESGLGGAIEELGEKASEAAMAFRKFDEEIADTLADLQEKHRDNLGKSREQLQKLDEKYREVSKEGREAIKELREGTKQNLAKITEDIAGVNRKMAELREEFDKQATADRGGLAQAFVEAEKRVVSLRDELARATDPQAILDIKNKIKAEEDALSKTTEVQKQFSAEIAEARRFAGLSELEQAIEEYNVKRVLAQQELTAKLSELEQEKSALREKRALEKQLLEEKTAEEQAKTEQKLVEIQKEKDAVFKQMVEEALLYVRKNEMIKQLITDALTFRMQAEANAHSATEEMLKKEIKLYQDLEAQIKRAANARSEGGISKRTISGRAEGGSIPVTGNYLLHQGEYVLNKRDAEGGMGGNNVYIQGGTYLSRDVAEQIGNMILDTLKTNTRI